MAEIENTTKPFLKIYRRSGVNESAYRRALKHPAKPWARDLIQRFEAQQQNDAKLIKYQLENLRDWTPAERAFAKLLKQIKARYIREHCFNCHDGRNYFVDFYIPNRRVAFEVDGGIHAKQQNYDTRRDIALMTDYSMPIVRFSNEDVLYEPERVKNMIIQILTERKEFRRPK